MKPPQFFRAALCLVLLLCLQVRGQNYLSLEPEIRPGTEQDGRRAVDLKIRAFNALGSPATSGPTNLTLRAYSFASGGMVISEVSSDGAEIEFANTGASDVDLSGWMLRVGAGTYFPSNSEARRITGNGRLKPGGLLVWSSRTNAPDQFPNLRRSHRLSPVYVNLVELRDPSGQLVDEVRFYDAPPTAGRLWTGPAVTSLGGFPNSIQRRGTRNHFAAIDWIVATPSIGLLNPDLSLPSGGPALPLTLDSQAATLTNGTWSGTVRLAASGVRSVRFEASVQDGLFFASQPVPLSPLPPLQLTVVSGSTRGSEATAGNLAEVEIRLPAPNSSGVPITPRLQFDVPGEFEVPIVGAIAPGEQRTVVQLRNLDDEVADGTAVVTLTALVPGFEPATLTLLNDDDEFATVHLSVPDQANEGEGLLPLRGLVSLPTRASHPTRIDLDFDGRVSGPEFVVIPTGAASAEFPVFIVDDGFENIAPLHDTITATTSEWLPVTSKISVRDDEFLSPSLSLPSRVLEGIPTNGIVALRFPRDHASTLRIRSSDSRLGIPTTVDFPAGVSSVSIPIPASDDHASVGSRYVNVCVTFAASFSGENQWCQGLDYAEKDPGTVTLRPTVDSLIWSGTPIPFTLVADDGYGVRPSVSGPVEMRISSGIGSAVVDPAFQTITLNDGSYAGALQINGSGQQLALEMVFRGRTNTLALPSVQSGRQATNRFQFLAARPGHATLLALRASPSGSSETGHLSEVDPVSGSVVREFNLPFYCTQIAVADSGSVAWASGPGDRLVRIDLEHWTNSVSTPVLGTNSPYGVFGLAVSKGATDELAVGLASPYGGVPPLVLGVRDGKPLLLDAQPNTGAFVIPGRTAGEFYLASANRLARFRLTETNAVTTRSREFSVFGNGNPMLSPVLVGKSLVGLSGAEVDAESLEDLAGFEYVPNVGRYACLPIPESNQVLYATQAQWNLYDNATRTPLASIPDPYLFNYYSVVRWGPDGVACLNSVTGGQLLVFDHLLRELGNTDLAVRLESPGTSAQLGDPVRFVATVSNQGTNSALGAVLKFETQTIPIGTLEPGETRLIPLTNVVQTAGQTTVSASVSAGLRDSQPLNNTATGSVMVLPTSDPRIHALDFPVRDLKLHPDGERLLAVAGSDSVSEGVAVIDPATASRVETLGVGTDPRRVSSVPNGDFLLVQLGDNRVVRWNLSSASVDASVTIPEGPILDVYALPEVPGRWLATTSTTLSLWEGTNQLSSVALPAGITAAQLGNTGRTNWLATTTDVFAVTTTGTQLDAYRRFKYPNPLEAPWFTVNANTLYFPGFRLDPVNRQYPFTSVGSPWMLSADQAFTIQPPFLLRLDSTSGRVLEQEVVSPLGYNSVLRNVVRWGKRGFALRTSTQLGLVFQSVVVANPGADLSAFIIPPDIMHFGSPGEFQVGVTNRGTSTAAGAQLAISSYTAQRLESIPPGQNLGGTWYVNVGPIAPGTVSIVRVLLTPNVYASTPFYGTLSAVLIGGGADASAPGHSVNSSVPVVRYRSNLSLELTTPPNPVAGADFKLTCRLVNLGAEPIVDPEIVFDAPNVPILRTTDRGSLVDGGRSGSYLNFHDTLINPGESLTAQVTCHADNPGAYPLMATAFSFSDETDFSNNSVGSIVQVGLGEAPHDYPNFFFLASWSGWSPARHEWVLGTDKGFYFFSADTLQLTAIIAYSHSSQFDRLTDDGNFVWMISGSKKVERFSLMRQSVDTILDSPVEFGANGLIATVPGHPDSLVAIGFDANFRFRPAAWVNGTPVAPNGEISLARQSPTLQLAASDDGAIYVQDGGTLREFLVDALGLRAGRILDEYAGLVIYDPKVANGLLLGGGGSALDLKTLQKVPSFGANGQIVDGIAYGIGNSPDGNYVLTAFNVETRSLFWSRPLALPSGLHASGGTNGVLFTGYQGGLVTPPAPAHETPTLTASLAQPILEIGQKGSVSISVTQPGAFSSEPLRLVANLSPGIQSDTPPATGPRWSIGFGTVLGTTNLTAQFTATTAGAQVMVLDLVAGAGEAAHAVDSVTIRWVTPELPVLLLQDLRVFDDGTPLQFRLNRPTPSALTIPLRATLIDAQGDDLIGLTAALNFPAGTQVAQVSWIKADTEIEPEEHFSVSIDSGPIRAVPESAIITIANDDLPNIAARGVTQNEGNLNAPPAVVAVLLDRASTVLVEVEFNTIPGTALPGEDYLPLSGRITFAPGTTLRTLSIPIVGDTRYEPVESFAVDFFGALNGRAPLAGPSITLINDDPRPAPSLQISQGATGELLLNLDTLVGVHYSLEFRTNTVLGTWKGIGTPFIGDGGAYSLPVSSDPDSTRFYRVTTD